MNSQIKLVSARQYPASPVYTQVGLDDFHQWVETVPVYQLDIETNVVDDLMERELYTLQFGSYDGTLIYVVDYASLPEDYRNYFIGILNRKQQQKIIHNALFEYTVIKKCCGIDIDNIYDTFLALKVMTNQKMVPPNFYSLAGAVETFFQIVMSKDLQTSFTGEMLTEDQILYAATDVMYMGYIVERLKSLPHYAEQENVINLENGVVRVFGDIMFNGFVFDGDVWRENMEWVKPQIEESREQIYEVMRTELSEECELLDFMSPEPEVTINWNSIPQRTAVLQGIYPDLLDCKKATLKAYENTLSEDNNILHFIMNKEYGEASTMAAEQYLELLESNGFYIPAGQMRINLNSPKQLLDLFRCIKPDITSVKAEVIEKIKHPLAKAFTTYVTKQKLLSSYGENWFEFVAADGRIRARFLDQILATGRVAFKKPGMMTVPADEGYYLGNRYRRAFKARPGFSIVASDFASQELAIIAFLAGEQVWIDTIKSGGDLHSKAASLVFGPKWITVGGHPDGAVKPDDSNFEALKLRSYTKTISFALAFGAGHKLIGERLNLTSAEAKRLIRQYFDAFPKLESYFQRRAAFGRENGFIYTAAPFHRRRYFPNWEEAKQENGFGLMAAIERESMNTSIQGTGADASKCAMILVKDYIDTHGLGDRVFLVTMLHDALATEVRDDFVEEWKPIQTELMILGHGYNIPDRLVGATTSVSKHWTK
jgi:DNA polymerase I-like protein with 3'-5' exonuclease and polymerase domains